MGAEAATRATRAQARDPARNPSPTVEVEAAGAKPEALYFKRPYIQGTVNCWQFEYLLDLLTIIYCAWTHISNSSTSFFTMTVLDSKHVLLAKLSHFRLSFVC